MVEEFSTKFAKEYRGVTRENERGGSARPIRMLRFVYRVFWPCQLRMGIDPIDSILPEIALHLRQRQTRGARPDDHGKRRLAPRQYPE